MFVWTGWENVYSFKKICCEIHFWSKSVFVWNKRWQRVFLILRFNMKNTADIKNRMLFFATIMSKMSSWLVIKRLLSLFGSAKETVVKCCTTIRVLLFRKPEELFSRSFQFSIHQIHKFNLHLHCLIYWHFSLR